MVLPWVSSEMKQKPSAGLMATPVGSSVKWVVSNRSTTFPDRESSNTLTPSYKEVSLTSESDISSVSVDGS